MSLEYAILGFLQYKPISGYDLKKMFDASIKHFWSADQSQIYRTLNKLTNEGLIDRKLIIQKSKPNSKIYTITEKGKEEFLNWLNAPMPMIEPRIPWLIQVFFAAQLSDDAIINIFQQTATQIRKKIDIYAEMNKEQFVVNNDGYTPRDLFFIELTYDYGCMQLNFILQWIEKTIKQIKEKEYLSK